MEPRQLGFHLADIFKQPRRRQAQEVEAEGRILVVELLDLLIGDRQ